MAQPWSVDSKTHVKKWNRTSNGRVSPHWKKPKIGRLLRLQIGGKYKFSFLKKGIDANTYNFGTHTTPYTFVFSECEFWNMKYEISNLIDTNKNNSNYDDDAEEESNSNRNIYYNGTQMKNLWRMVVIIWGRWWWNI